VKVVINRSHGGFGLSPLGVHRLMQLQGKECHFFAGHCADDTHKPKTEITVVEASGHWAWHCHEKAEHPRTPVPWEQCTDDQRRQYGVECQWWPEAGATDDGYHYRDIARDSLALVQVVEELGAAANGSCADLKVVEVPDDVSWEIEEYDGLEWVTEIHRTWH